MDSLTQNVYGRFGDRSQATNNGASGEVLHVYPKLIPLCQILFAFNLINPNKHIGDGMNHPLITTPSHSVLIGSLHMQISGGPIAHCKNVFPSPGPETKVSPYSQGNDADQARNTDIDPVTMATSSRRFHLWL